VTTTIITYCGPDPDKNQLWKVIARIGTREDRNLRAVHMPGLTQTEALAVTPDDALRFYREGLGR
jgi:hypothetical protein